MPQCEAEGRIKRTLYVMENDWAAGSFDYGKIRGILSGRDTAECAEQCGTSVKLGP